MTLSRPQFISILGICFVLIVLFGTAYYFYSQPIFLWGVDSGYLALAQKKAVGKCGGNILPLGIALTQGKITYTFTGGDCGSDPGHEIEVYYSL